MEPGIFAPGVGSVSLGLAKFKRSACEASGLFARPYRVRNEYPGCRAERDHNMRPVTREVCHIANHNTNDRADSGAKCDLDGTHVNSLLPRCMSLLEGGVKVQIFDWLTVGPQCLR